MRPFAFKLFWESQILIQITAMSDLGDVLITCGYDAKTTSLKMWDFLITSSTISEVISKFVFSKK